VFETFDETLVVFLGSWGAEGVLVHRGAGRWEFFGPSSVEWDGFHQGAYANHRATRLSVDDLARRGIVLPALDQYRGRPSGRWEDRFPIEMPVDEAPPALRARLEPASLTVYLALLEDRYETAHGDGKFLYPEAAFLDRNAADVWIRATVEAEPDPARRDWYEYSVRPVALRLDPARRAVVMDPPGLFEHYGIRDVVSRLPLA